VTIPPRTDNRVLRLNVGFLLKEGPGYAREFNFTHHDPLRVEDVAIVELVGALRLTRTRQGIVLQGTLHTQSIIECVRCLDPFNLPFSIEISELFAYPPPIPANPYNPYIVDEGGVIDLSPIIREEGILAIPIQALCRPDCQGLCPECGQNLNKSNCGHSHNTGGDPRLAALRALLERS
jgi:DUF177 domain-containing protein